MDAVRTQPRPTGAARLVPPPSAMPSAWQIAWPWLFWACWGVWLAVSDLRNDDLPPAVLRLLLGGAVLGFMRPSRWWLWSLALAAWVPAEPLVAGMLKLTPGFEYNAGMWLLPPLPALVGGFLGRGIARGAAARRVP